MPSVQWSSVSEILVAGLGLGCAVPRLVRWRGPAVFAVDCAVISGEASRPPFLRLDFRPGSGYAGLALLNSRKWPGAGALAGYADTAEWGQTFAGYSGRDVDIVAYGLAGQALTSAGVLRRQGISVQAKCFINVPVLSSRELEATAGDFGSFFLRAAEAVDRFQGELAMAAQVAFGYKIKATSENRTPDGERPAEKAIRSAPLPCDYLDAAYFALADLVYEQLLATGALRSGDRRNLKVRAAVLERPAELWQLLTAKTAPE